jgi:GT2 family glycosyltransferase
MSTLKICAATVVCSGPGLVLPGANDGKNIPLLQYLNRDNQRTPCQAYQQIHERTVEDGYAICVYCHDDLTVHDHDWLDRVQSIFMTQRDCIAVGFGGATQLGQSNLYKRPYALSNMARSGYRSNQTDWPVHGTHETNSAQVAVLDAFCMAVRVSWLQERGGWPTAHLSHHCLDLWLACEAARDAKSIWMTGVSCTHHGGGSSTKPVYEQAEWLQGGSLASDHERPHKWLAEQYRDVLPIVVEERCK